jgi:hypothetical protein
MILHQDQPDYAAFEGELVMPYTFEAMNAFTPLQSSKAYARGGVIESDERVDYYWETDEETGARELKSRPRRISVRYVIDQRLERDRAKQERDQHNMFKFT